MQSPADINAALNNYGSSPSDYMSTLDKINRLGNTGLLDTPSDFTSPISWDHPYMSSEDATYSQALKSQLADDMFGVVGKVGYGVIQPIQEAIRNALGMQFAPSDDPSDYRSQAVSGYPTGVMETAAQVATGWADVPPGVRELVDDLIEENVLGITTPDVTPTTFTTTPTVTAPTKPAYSGPTAAELRAAKRATDLENQKAAARAKAAADRLAELRAKQTAADEARQVQDAIDRQTQKDAARALIARAASSDRSPYSEAEINAAREVLGEIDTFASGNPFEARQNAGPAAGYGGYRGDPVGRQAAIESRGGGRNGGGRSHGGGHHGR